MKISLITKPTLPMIAKPSAQDVAILINSRVRRGKTTLFVRLGALLHERDTVFVEVDQVGLGFFDVVRHVWTTVYY